ncbi:MAG: cytochrome c [Candidatus Solibacter sp.]
MTIWKGVAVGFLVALLFLAFGAWLFFGMGLAPVATASDPMPFETYLAHRGLKAVVHRASATPSPVEPNETNLKAGAALYRMNCAVCHGLPGLPASAISLGMFPKPPQLFKGKGVTDDPVGETFWLVRNGIRLSGMPGFRDSLSDTEMWQVSQLLAHAGKLSDDVKSELHP